ncbi:putative RNA-directed DNA polymerase, eukaryota, reverse transcriptase zinc-binding domain protein [Tanacetum coccineum]
MAKVIDDIIHPVQSAFVKGRQILDGLLVVNKVIEWYKKKKKKCMLFNVDFDKAYDSVSWEYLFKMMEYMRFNTKCIQWIRSCLVSSRTSILVNAMEGLHVAIEDVVDHGLFRALRVGSEEVLISHLFYADDAMLMGEWNEENITNLIVILDCFFLISGLKINLYKSKLYGVGVPMQDIENRAVITRCSSATIPFKYLGLPVGNNMNRSSNWENMIQKVKKKLGTWKVKLLPIVGRLTLTKSMLGSLGTYFMSMFKMPEMVNRKIEATRA